MNSQAAVLAKQACDAPDLVHLTKTACDVAKTAASQAIDGFINGSPAALEAVRRCEEQLDELDRFVDDRLSLIITQVTPEQARELLACMKLMIDLERVGDLIVSFAERAAIVRTRLEMPDVEQLTKMACLLENMLNQIATGFSTRNPDHAIHVLRTDAEMDRVRNLLVVRHTESFDGPKGQESLHVLSMANALERAGDHVKNLAEELCHLATGHSVRHLIRSKDKPVEQLFLDWIKQSSSV